MKLVHRKVHTCRKGKFHPIGKYLDSTGQTMQVTKKYYFGGKIQKIVDIVVIGRGSAGWICWQ